MKKARIIIGANYGDEGKGTVVARYTKESENVLNVLTNGGAQRAHSILTNEGNITYKHFGSGTFYGADTYYSRFFILNPMLFEAEYNNLTVKPKNIYRDPECRWSTPYDSFVNFIKEITLGRHASCGMGIWNTIQRYNNLPSLRFSKFNKLSIYEKKLYLSKIKQYYEQSIVIPDTYKSIWDSPILVDNFIDDCMFMFTTTIESNFVVLSEQYDNIIFENGQGLLLTDNGNDTFDRTPSNTGIQYALEILKDVPNILDITAHYVTRPYLTRHGDGEMENECNKSLISGSVSDDRINVYNDFQGNFRYGKLNLDLLKDRIIKDAQNIKFELDVTHCDEVDLISDFRKHFDIINVYDSPLI